MGRVGACSPLQLVVEGVKVLGVLGKALLQQQEALVVLGKDGGNARCMTRCAAFKVPLQLRGDSDLRGTSQMMIHRSPDLGQAACHDVV